MSTPLPIADPAPADPAAPPEASLRLLDPGSLVLILGERVDALRTSLGAFIFEVGGRAPVATRRAGARAVLDLVERALAEVEGERRRLVAATPALGPWQRP